MASTLTLQRGGVSSALNNNPTKHSFQGKTTTMGPRVTRKQKETLERRPTLAEVGNKKTSRIPVPSQNAKKSKNAHPVNQQPNPESHNWKAAPPHNAAPATSKPTQETTTTMDKKPLLKKEQPRGCHKRSTTTTKKVDELENILDVDAQDTFDPQLCKEYVQDIYRNLRAAERHPSYAIQPSFLSRQTQVAEWHRAILVDWLVLVQRKFRLLQETLYLAIDTLDRYLQVVEVSKADLQLVGVSALFIAAKYEEIYPPSIDEMVYITANTYTTTQLRETERTILEKLGYLLNKPLPINFLRRYSKIASACTRQHALAKYILEISALKASLSSMPPSKRAAGAILLARSILNPGEEPRCIWTPTLAYYSEYSFSDIEKSATELRHALKEGHAHKKFVATREKYADASFMKISCLKALEKL